MPPESATGWCWNGWETGGPKLVEAVVVNGATFVVGEYPQQVRLFESRVACLEYFHNDAKTALRGSQERCDRIGAMLLKAQAEESN